MPRRAFVADLQNAKDSVTTLPPNVFDLQNGEDDGTFRFIHKPTARLTAVTVQVHIPDLSLYPLEHSCYVYTTSENVPAGINRALSDMEAFGKKTVANTIAVLASLLDKACTEGSCQNPISVEGDSDVEMEDTGDGDSESEGQHTGDDENEYEPSDYDDDQDIFSDVPRPLQLPTADRNTHSIKGFGDFNRRVRNDLRQTKAAGFRVAHLGQPLNNGQGSYVLVSCRVSRLGIPEDTLLAWTLDAQDYIMLMIHYTMGYKTLEQATPSAHNVGVVLHVGVSKRHKIGLTEAINAFSQLEQKKKSTADQHVEKESEQKSKPDLRALFIGRPLDELLNNRLPLIVQYRLGFGLSWKGAEDFYQDHQGLNIKGSNGIDDKYYEKYEPNMEHLPELVTADHMESRSQDHSFPLVAMQFMLRHLVRCTEFCLVCHCRIDANFEALKPYVCSKPLCLYQYMALGFGPSIEYEIISQPYVVDLLISFCYASAYSRTLKDFPLGMGLTVPEPSLVPACTAERLTHVVPPARQPVIPGSYSPTKGIDLVDEKGQSFTAGWDEVKSELVLTDPIDTRPPVAGDWVIFGNKHKQAWQHRRILAFSYPKISLGPSILLSPENPNTELSSSVTGWNPSNLRGRQIRNALTSKPVPSDVITPKQGELPSVDVVVYGRNFDSLTPAEQQSTVCLLLCTLPSVQEMRDFLQKMGDKRMSLRNWTNRISPAALGVLRWIIASNRSCIVQIDSLDPDAERNEDRVAGMDGYMQFRFAQGAPDKEQRFMHSVQTTTKRLDLKHPTIFAWHGSPVENWHGIVREGLHFKNVIHGRAYGNGVYHSLDAHTSLSYASSRTLVSQCDALPSSWSSSLLKITSTLSLNELVNAPHEYINSNPHLVVQNVDWIQTRYLFVMCNVAQELFATKHELPTQVLEQDPKMQPKGVSFIPSPASLTQAGRGHSNINSPIKTSALIIPVTAVSKSRRPITVGVKHGFKRSKITAKSSPIKLEMSGSEETDIEDTQILLSDQDFSDQGEPLSKPPAPKYTSKTDFVPGLLDWDTLPLLAPPAYATPQASKALQRELKAALKAQDAIPLNELGWYLSADHITNVYQWIVELHSFDPSIPLAKDMKAQKITSVVLELRFGQTFPYSPPFVRVIRPKFLPFIQGGGGHVTAGGALCMELLTNNGWNPASSIEAVLLQVRLAMMSLDPKPARLDIGSKSDYGVGEAIEAYRRACMMHGWEVPKDFAAFR